MTAEPATREPTPVPTPGVATEVGRLRTVMLHRPGNELRRLTPRNNDALLFDGLPWVDRAQEEHDAFAEALRTHGVEVLYLSELLAQTLEEPEARAAAVDRTLTGTRLGDSMRAYLEGFLSDHDAAQLAEVLMAGLAVAEIGPTNSLVTALSGPEDFVIDPLPNLLFTRDSSVWVQDRPTVTSLAMPARRRETQLTDLIYTFHPRFAGRERLHGSDREFLEGGDVLALADGVLAVGVGERTRPAGVERLARAVFERGLAQTVLAVPIDQDRATMHLDTICTMVDVDAVVMYPNVAHRLAAVAVRPGDGDDLVISPTEPFVEAAARAMGIGELRVIDTGLDPITAEREQWDDGNNTLAIGPKLTVAYERNVETNERLEHAGIEVIRIAGSELGSGRGGPRCMSCPISRD